MKRVILTSIFIFIVITFINNIYSSQLRYTPFHSDEILWPCLSKNIYSLLLSGNWQFQLWTKDKFAFSITPIPRYIYGLWISTKFGPSFYEDMDCQNYTSYFNQSLSNLNNKQLLYLFSLRNLNKFFALFVLILSFILFQNLYGTAIATIGIFLLGLNPIFRTYATRSMAEMIFMFTLITGLVLLRISQNRYKLNPHIFSVIIGIWSGITAMTKLYGVMLFGVYMLYLVLQKDDYTKKLVRIITSLSCLILTIILIYPPFFIIPSSMIGWSSIWFSVYDSYRKIYPLTIFNGPLGFLFTSLDRLIFPGNFTLFRSIPIINIALIIPGVFIFMFKFVKKRRFSSSEIFIFAIVISFILFSILFFHILTDMIYFQMHWDRYFLPLIFGEILLQLFVLNILWVKIKSILLSVKTIS